MFHSDLLQGQVALVTGGGSGIGLAISREFLLHGATVVIASRNAERLENAKKTLEEYGIVYTYALDIRKPESVEALATFIQETCGRLDHLVNNAGGQFPAAAADISPNGWLAVINTNLNGTWFVTQSIARHFFFKQEAGGTITNIIVNHYRGFPGMAHTGAARAGIDNLTKSLAIEWVSKNIRVNAVAPGIINSTGLENYPPEMVAQVAGTIPMKRLGTVDEVAQLVLFLSSSYAGYITGETVYIDGGSRLWGSMWQME
ncbi:MAG: SDR family oxidoreductase [Saprospiraceae bacterium]|nr:SDR family oxidoreductase [Saprospiraceae bacterium]